MSICIRRNLAKQWEIAIVFIAEVKWRGEKVLKHFFLIVHLSIFRGKRKKEMPFRIFVEIIHKYTKFVEYLLFNLICNFFFTHSFSNHIIPQPNPGICCK